MPQGGIQPQVQTDAKGVVHMLYLGGDPKNADVFYVRSSDGGATFSTPIRVNSQAGSAIALGTIRGEQFAIGKNGRVHVAWNGSSIAEPKRNGAPMMYTRLNDAGTAFEPQRNLMTQTFGLDGGGTIAADADGNVYVAWHGKTEGAPEGEVGRQVWIARSTDDGKTFAAEQPAWKEPTGACGCCGMAMFTDRAGNVYAFYRAARESVHRDIYLLVSKDRGKSFQGGMVHPWELNACPMSSMSFTENGGAVEGAWETAGQVFYASLDAANVRASQPIAAPGEGKGRKHPRIVRNSRGETMMVWTEGTGWQRGGSLAWQVYDADGHPTANHGADPGVPAWSFAAAIARPDGGFSIVY